MFGYLPKEGFAFFAPITDFHTIKESLLKRVPKGLPVGYERLINSDQAPFPANQPRYLGNPSHQWETLPLAERPLIINWMLTRECNYKCTYCYAQDMMHMSNDVTNKEQIETIIDNIKSYLPIAVVVTGGEPTLNQYFYHTIRELSKFTSVIVDTNATSIQKSHIDLFKDNNVHVRISIDSNKPINNAKTRKSIRKYSSPVDFDNIWNNLTLLKEFSINTTINTVATTHNYDYIISLRDSLKKFGIEKMRIRLAEKSKTIANYNELRGDDRRVNRFITHTLKSAPECESVPIYLSMNRQRNSIILVSPSGEFYTESYFIDRGKILIDPESPQRPSMDAIRKRVDMHAHSARYLSL